MVLTGKKNTLLNSLFGTNFMEMDAFKGRYGCHLIVFSFDYCVKVCGLIQHCL